MRLRVGLALTLAMAAGTGPLWAADTASAPTTSPAAETTAGTATQAGSVNDFFSPQAAIRSYLQAYANQLDLSLPRQDDAAVRDTLFIPDEHKDEVNALLDLSSTTALFERDCASIFGKAETLKTFGTSASDTLAARLKTIDKAAVDIHGDTATVKIPEDPTTHQPAGEVTVRKINGDWKIDAASMFQLAGGDAAATQQRVALSQKLAAIQREMAKDVLAHKYSTVRQAYEEFWTRARAALPATTATATTTATAPATRP